MVDKIGLNKLDTDAPTGNEKVYGVVRDNKADLNGDMINPDILWQIIWVSARNDENF